MKTPSIPNANKKFTVVVDVRNKTPSISDKINNYLIEFWMDLKEKELSKQRVPWEEKKKRLNPSNATLKVIGEAYQRGFEDGKRSKI